MFERPIVSTVEKLEKIDRDMAKKIKYVSKDIWNCDDFATKSKEQCDVGCDNVDGVGGVMMAVVILMDAVVVVEVVVAMVVG